MIVCGIVTQEEFMQGFSNDGMMTIGMMFVVVTPVARTGILQILTKSVFIFKKYPRFNLLIIMITCSFLSFWMNNTPIVALFIPLIRDWCIENDVSPSKFLIPLSYSTIAGGMCTIIGTSTNLVVNGFMENVGEESFGFFELGYMGLPILGVLIIYIITIGYCVLPNHIPSDKKKSDITGNIFVCELPILQSSYLKNKTVNYINNRFLVEIVEIQRQDAQIKIPQATDKISIGDKIILKTTSQNLVNMMDIISYDLEDFSYKKFTYSEKDSLNQEIDSESQPLVAPKSEKKKKGFIENLKEKIFPEDSKTQFYEIILGDQFQLLNQKLNSNSFQDKYNAQIYGVRRTGQEIADLAEYEFQIGDQLVVLSNEPLDQIITTDFFSCVNVKVEKFAKEEKKVLKLLDQRFDVTWWRYLSIPVFVGMVSFAAAGFGMFICALITICIMVIIGLIDGNDGLDAIDFKLMILISCSMSIGKGIQNSYLAETLSSFILRIPFPSYVLPGIIFLITQTVSATVTNNAAATIVFPVAYALAERVNMPFRPFGIAVALGASADFSTPIGYQTNLMVQRPGMYSFFDYIKVGLPLNFICSAMAMGLLPLIYRK